MKEKIAGLRADYVKQAGERTMEKSAREHALAVIKAGISLVPSVGGAVASLIGDYVPTHSQQSIDSAIKMLNQRLTILSERIDMETLNKDEFAELFKSCYLTIIRTHQEEKLKAAVSLITNILLRNGDPEKLSYNEIDHFVRCIDNLSIGAIHVLGKTYEIWDVCGSKRSHGASSFISLKTLGQGMSEIRIDLLMGLAQELNSLHLFQVVVGRAAVEDYEHVNVAITSLGRHFVEHLLFK